MGNNTLKNKIRGSLIGGAVGDALGYQIEFDIGIREKQVTSFPNDFGVISDDTQMTLFTANALLWRHTRWLLKGIAMQSHEAVYHGYLDWYKTQTYNGNNGVESLIKEIYLKTDHIKGHDQICWLTDVEGLHKRQAPGNTCLSSLRSGKMGTIEKPINNSKGCGGVMRIAPCGLINRDPDAAGFLAAQCAATTHSHPMSHMASYACAAMISMLTYQDISVGDAVNRSLKLTQSRKDNFNDKGAHIEAFTALIQMAIDLSKQNISDSKAIKKLGEGWSAEDALAIAVYACLKYPTSFQDAIICAANHDGDSDSTAAIAGNILGAHLGFSAIDSYYINNVELKNVILEMADDLYETLTNDSIAENDDWLRKYS